MPYMHGDQEAWFPPCVGWTKNTQKPKFFEKPKKSSKTEKTPNVLKYAKISDTPFDQRSLIHREAWFIMFCEKKRKKIYIYMFCEAKSSKKNYFFCLAILDHFKQICSNLRPLFSITFPQGFRISQHIGHPTSESWGKKSLKRYLKSEQTDTHTRPH